MAFKNHGSVRTQHAAVNKFGKVSTVSRVQCNICVCAYANLSTRVCASKPTCHPAPSAPPQICAHVCNTARDLYISHLSGSTCFLITYGLCLFLIFLISP